MHSGSDRGSVDVWHGFNEKTDQKPLSGPLTPPLLEKQAYFASPIPIPGAGGRFRYASIA